LASPSGTLNGLALDIAGNIYVANETANSVMKWSPTTQQLTTVVGTGLSLPNWVAVDTSGNVYISDLLNQAIKKWSAATQQVTTLATTTATGLGYPGGIAVDGTGNVYFSSSPQSGGDLWAIPYAFVAPAGVTESAAAGSDSLLPVLPSTAILTGVFAPVSDQSWLTIGNVSNGVVNFSFANNTTSSAQIAHITVLGQPITVTQSGLLSQTITFGTLPNQVLGTAPFTVSATASSGLAVSFGSTTTSICTVSGSTVTLVAVGTCTVQATQGGNPAYAAATPVSESLQVSASGTATFASSQSTLYSNPSYALYGVAVDRSGNVYVTDNAGNQLYELRAVGGAPLPVESSTSSNYGLGAVAVDTGLDAGGLLLYGSYGVNGSSQTAGLGPSVVESYAAGDTGSRVVATGNTYCCFGYREPSAGNAMVVFQSVAVTPGNGGDTVQYSNQMKFLTYTNGTASAVTLLPTQGLVLTLDQWLDASRQNLIYVGLDDKLYYSNYSGTAFGTAVGVSGSALTLTEPFGMAADQNDNVFLTDVGTNQVYMVPWSGSASVNAAGGHYGTQVAIASGLSTPRAVAVDRQGIGYVADTGNNRIVKIQPGAASFGTANVCTASQTTGPCSQTLTLNYNLSGTVAFGTPAITGNADFALAAGGTCTGAVSAAMCTVNVTFTPAANGSRSATLQLLDPLNNVLASTSLTGTGQGNPLVSIAVTPATPSLPDGSSQQFTATGTYADNSTTDLTASVSWSTSDRFNTYISPMGLAFTMLRLDLPAQVTISATQGQVTGSTVATVAVQTISFPAIANQGLSTGTVQVSATATTGFAVLFASQTPSVCTVSGSTVTLLTTGTCTIQASTSPTGITLAAVPVSQSFQIQTGQTIAAPAFSNVALNFGNEAVGVTSASQTVIVTNIATNSLTVSTVAASGDFSQTNNCATVAASGTCTITVTFTPTLSGLRTGFIAISDNASISPQRIRLSGTGVSGSVAGVSLSNVALNFGAQALNTTSAVKAVILTNNGSATLTVSGITATGNFAQTNNCGSVAVAANCTINVTFTPTATGVSRGSVIIADSATGSMHVIRLSGTGTAVAPAVGLSNVNLDFASQATGTTSSAQTITVTNTGSATLTISAVTASGDFAASGCVTSLSAGATCTLSVTFTPSATGARRGTVAITDNAVGSPQMIELFGSGT
jgi:hypothetical protein